MKKVLYAISIIWFALTLYSCQSTKYIPVESVRIDSVSIKDTIFEVKLIPSFPQLFYPLMTRQFFCDFHEKSEDFCVS